MKKHDLSVAATLLCRGPSTPVPNSMSNDPVSGLVIPRRHLPQVPESTRNWNFVIDHRRACRGLRARMLQLSATIEKQVREFPGGSDDEAVISLSVAQMFILNLQNLVRARAIMLDHLPFVIYGPVFSNPDIERAFDTEARKIGWRTPQTELESEPGSGRDQHASSYQS